MSGSLRRKVVAALFTMVFLLAACQSVAPIAAPPLVVATEALEPPSIQVTDLATVGNKVKETPPMEAAGISPLTPAVMVLDQEITGGEVIIAEVVSNGPGWLVIHCQADGKPGPILGFSPIADGVNEEVRVAIDGSKATKTLYAMLHKDGGEVNKFEYPNGPDAPVIVDGIMINPSFEAAVVSAETPSPVEATEIKQTAVLMLGGNDNLGSFLVGFNGMTLYVFLKDQPGVSSCFDQCAANWSPMLLKEGETLISGEGITGQLSIIQRSDGGNQVTYNGMPLYFFVGDIVPGDANGNGLNGVWKVATLMTTPPTSYSSTPAPQKEKKERGY